MKIDPVIGAKRNCAVIDILLRRRQNNPILVGEAGGRQTAVAEALACKIAQGRRLPPLQGARLLFGSQGACRLGQAHAGANSNRA